MQQRYGFRCFGDKTTWFDNVRWSNSCLAGLLEQRRRVFDPKGVDVEDAGGGRDLVRALPDGLGPRSIDLTPH